MQIAYIRVHMYPDKSMYIMYTHVSMYIVHVKVAVYMLYGEGLEPTCTCKYDVGRYMYMYILHV